MRWMWLVIPAALAALRLLTGRYAFSALTSMACAAAVAANGLEVCGWLMAAGLLISVIGDWLLAHQDAKGRNFLCGVACFGAGHVLFALYAARRFTVRPLALAVTALLAAAYAAYLWRCVLPEQEAPMRAALSGYAAISLLGLFFALSLGGGGWERALYAVGIACIVFSDTMIAEAEFVGHAWARPLILPTYYLCHILLLASRLFR